MVPAERGGTEGGGTVAEATTSQYSAVAGTASFELPGQAGMEKGAVLPSLADGMTRDGVCMYPVAGGVTSMKKSPPAGHEASLKFMSNL